jgi:hypothetical protein
VWQLAQLEVLPLAVWFIVQLENPPEAVLVWHDSHASVVVTCEAGLPLTVVVPTVVSPEAEWQLAQFVERPTWFIVQLGAAKPPVLVLLME